MGFFVILTNTRISEEDILRMYRGKDVVEKAFMRSKSVMEPLYAVISKFLQVGFRIESPVHDNHH